MSHGTLVVAALAVSFVFRSLVLLGCMWGLIHVQKLYYQKWPLVGAAFLGGAIDTVPLVGHFIAVPALYLCVWKITRSSLYPDATFTVGISYALVRCLSWIIAAYIPFNFHPKASPDPYDFNFNDNTNSPPMAHAQAPRPVQHTNDTAQPDPQEKKLANKVWTAISIKGVIQAANGSLVTIQYHAKDYTLSPDEGVVLSIDNDVVPVRLMKVSDKNIKLAVGPENVTYAVK